MPPIHAAAKATGISRQRIGRLLHKAGVAVKPRGAGRQRPPDAEQIALTDLAERLYLQSNLSSGQISALIGVPERTIRSRLRARGVRMRTRGRSCGLGLRHIELISGQPAETIRSRLHGQNIKLRPPGGRSPFMRRWRKPESLMGEDSRWHG